MSALTRWRRRRKGFRKLENAWRYLNRVDPTYCSDSARLVLTMAMSRVLRREGERR